jgi:hypothetical protein
MPTSVEDCKVRVLWGIAEENLRSRKWGRKHGETAQHPLGRSVVSMRKTLGRSVVVLLDGPQRVHEAMAVDGVIARACRGHRRTCSAPPRVLGGLVERLEQLLVFRPRLSDPLSVAKQALVVAFGA